MSINNPNAGGEKLRKGEGGQINPWVFWGVSLVALGTFLYVNGNDKNTMEKKDPIEITRKNKIPSPPSSSLLSISTSSITPVVETKEKQSLVRFHGFVRDGDTLSKICERHGVECTRKDIQNSVGKDWLRKREPYTLVAKQTIVNVKDSCGVLGKQIVLKFNEFCSKTMKPVKRVVPTRIVSERVVPTRIVSERVVSTRIVQPIRVIYKQPYRTPSFPNYNGGSNSNVNVTVDCLNCSNNYSSGYGGSSSSGNSNNYGGSGSSGNSSNYGGR